MKENLINLVEIEPEEGTYLYKIVTKINKKGYEFLFDTGAFNSQVSEKDFSHLQSVGKSITAGASGLNKSVDYVNLEEVAFGHRNFKGLSLKRGHQSILGIDLLCENAIEIDLKKGLLNLVSEYREHTQPLKVLTRGHFCMAISLNGHEEFALFDTGFNSSAVDLEFVLENPGMFEFVRDEDGVDGNGNIIPSKVYRVNDFKIGELTLNNLEIVAFRYPDPFKEALENVRFAIGNNIIREAKWFIDYQNQKWDLSYCSYYLN